MCPLCLIRAYIISAILFLFSNTRLRECFVTSHHYPRYEDIVAC